LQYDRHLEEAGMNTKLKHIDIRPELAQQAKWSASMLAKICGVSVRTLERHFHKQMGKTPKKWLTQKRQSQADELLRDGKTVKETATIIGYKCAQHFSRGFKKYWGYCPTMNSTLPRTEGRRMS
jgi:AraC-like DNA-binding protein